MYGLFMVAFRTDISPTRYIHVIASSWLRPSSIIPIQVLPEIIAFFDTTALIAQYLG